MPFATSTSDDQHSEPWKRLFNTNTLSSSRHQVFNVDTKAPNDSLDFLIKTKYNQHEDLLRSINRTRYQKETFDDDHGFVFDTLK